MRSTLFLIPFEIGGVPLFGLGVLLAVWAVGCLLGMAWLVRRHGLGREAAGYLPVMALLGAVLYFLPTFFADVGGIPIRGYGVMILLGASGGIGLAAWRARAMGLNPDVIVSVCFWMIVVGILSSRLFYVIQYWEAEFHQPTLRATLQHVVDYTRGGLVVYGALIGGAATFFWYMQRHRLPAFALADLIAPGVAFGMAVGRIGCFLNGCCYGGLCEQPWAVAFPKPDPPYVLSPPYEHQASLGQFRGFSLGDDPRGEPIVAWVATDSPAELAGLKSGDRVEAINGSRVSRNGDAHHLLSVALKSGAAVEIKTRRSTLKIAPIPPPNQSLSVHPTQLYSAALSGTIALLLWSFYPFRRRDGQVLALLMTVYPVGRFLLEKLRTDELGRFGTSLTISQWISIAMLVAAAAMWATLRTRPSRLALPAVDGV